MPTFLNCMVVFPAYVSQKCCLLQYHVPFKLLMEKIYTQP